MRQTSLSNVLRNAALAAFASLVMVGTSNAAVYRTIWDPQFNLDFTFDVGQSVGWRGEAFISVDDACLMTSIVVSFPNGCGTATLDSYSLIFYNTLPSNVLYTSTDAGPGLPDLDPGGAVSFDEFGIADGIDLSGPISVPGTFTFGTSPIAFSAALDFTLDGPTLTLFNNSEDVSYDSGLDGLVPKSTWSLVPEPASLALVGAALVALGLSRRRKT